MLSALRLTLPVLRFGLRERKHVLGFSVGLPGLTLGPPRLRLGPPRLRLGVPVMLELSLRVLCLARRRLRNLTALCDFDGRLLYHCHLAPLGCVRLLLGGLLALPGSCRLRADLISPAVGALQVQLLRCGRLRLEATPLVYNSSALVRNSSALLRLPSALLLRLAHLRVGCRHLLAGSLGVAHGPLLRLRVQLHQCAHLL